MTRICHASILSLLLVSCVVPAVRAQDVPAPVVHWVFTPERVRDQALQAAAGSASIPWPSSLEFASDETPPALRLDGTQALPLPDELRAALLPRGAMSADAWVRVDRPLEWGGILSGLQDNGDFEKGWLLGFRGTRFAFGLATVGADDGNGRLTYLSSTRFVRLGAWQHVAATYDGTTAVCYVDGRPAGETRAQSGDILYADAFPWVIGAYQDDNEKYPLTGRLYSLRLWHRALSPQEVAALRESERARFVTGKAAVPEPAAGLVAGAVRQVEPHGVGSVTSVVAPTKQLLRPAGDSLAYAARPVDIALAPNGKWLYAKDHRGLAVVDTSQWQLRQHLAFPDGGASMHGLLVSPDGTRLWATTAQAELYEAEIDEQGQVEWSRAIDLPGPGGQGDSHACGLALSGDGQRLYVCLSRNNTLAEVELESGRVLREIPVGVAPFDVVLLDEDRRAAVSNWGGRRPEAGERTAPSSGTPVLIDERGVASSGTVGWVDLVAGQQVREVATGLHPSDLCWHPPTQRLFVANANSDTVTIIDTARFEELETIVVRPDPALPYGSATNAVAVTADGNWLVAANGGNNALALIQLAAPAQQPDAPRAPSVVAGFLPTAWYPGAVAIHGDEIFVANVKGFGSRADQDAQRRHVKSYLGVLSKVSRPSPAQLEEWTHDVRHAARVPQMLRALERSQSAAPPCPVPQKLGDPSVIEHVIYVIKENRTYDQVFGDLPQGRGEPKLCIYGRDVTPNHHALAETFVLLDNYYCNGINSADGHSWSTEGNVTDHLEKSFGGFTRSYTFGDDPLTYSSTGFIWDNVLLHGLSFRNYGEMDYAEPVPNNASFRDIYRDFTERTGRIRFTQQIGIEPLRRYSCPTFPGWNMKIPDVLRVEALLGELRAAEQTGEWPNFTLVFLPQDHTSGLSAGMPTPAAHMADNDLALGRLVEAVSHSRFWPKTCIFVIEDDPQDGFDHVDGHRSICLVISPYARRGAVVGEFYNQTSVLHTMERMLGCPPMNQMDAMSPLMSACFTDTPDLTPYTARPAGVPLDQLTEMRHLPEGLQPWVAASAAQNFAAYDQADEDTLNRILWHAARGPEALYPADWAGAHGRGLAARRLVLLEHGVDDDDEHEKHERPRPRQEVRP